MKWETHWGDIKILQLWIWISSRKESNKHTNTDTCSWIFINRNNSCSPVAPLSAHNGACCDAIQFVVWSCILLFHFSLYKAVVLTLKWFCGGNRGDACVALWNCMKICNLENRQLQGSQNRTKSMIANNSSYFLLLHLKITIWYLHKYISPKPQKNEMKSFKIYWI